MSAGDEIRDALHEAGVEDGHLQITVGTVVWEEHEEIVRTLTARGYHVDIARTTVPAAADMFFVRTVAQDGHTLGHWAPGLTAAEHETYRRLREDGTEYPLAHHLATGVHT